MSFGKSGNVQKTTQNQQSNTGVDQWTQDYMKRVADAAAAAGTAGPSPLATGAGDYNTGMMGAGQAGLAALGGDAAAAQKLMNPYQQQVIDATNQQWNQNDAQTQLGMNDAATKAGAFGGGRHGVAAGVAQAQNNMNRNAQVSGLLSSGYGDAMGRAGQLAGMGFNAAGANANLGMGGVGSPAQWYAQQLRQGWLGPTGQNSSGSGAQTTQGMQWGVGRGSWRG